MPQIFPSLLLVAIITSFPCTTSRHSKPCTRPRILHWQAGASQLSRASYQELSRALFFVAHLTSTESNSYPQVLPSLPHYQPHSFCLYILVIVRTLSWGVCCLGMKVSHRKQERVDQQTRIRVGTQMSLNSGSKAMGSQQGSPTLLFVLQSYSLPRLCLPLWSMSFLSQLLPWSLLLWHKNHQTVWVLHSIAPAICTNTESPFSEQILECRIIFNGPV